MKVPPRLFVAVLSFVFAFSSFAGTDAPGSEKKPEFSHEQLKRDLAEKMEGYKAARKQKIKETAYRLAEFIGEQVKAAPYSENGLLYYIGARPGYEQYHSAIDKQFPGVLNGIQSHSRFRGFVESDPSTGAAILDKADKILRKAGIKLSGSGFRNTNAYAWTLHVKW